MKVAKIPGSSARFNQANDGLGKGKDESSTREARKAREGHFRRLSRLSRKTKGKCSSRENRLLATGVGDLT